MILINLPNIASAKRFFFAIGLAVVVCLIAFLLTRKSADPYSPQPQASLKPILSIDWKKGPGLPLGFQDSDGGIIGNTLVTISGYSNDYLRPLPPGKEAKYPNPGRFLQEVWGLNLKSPQNGWEKLPDFPGSARQEHFAIVVDNQLYVWGGFNYTAPYTYRDGYRLSKTAQNQWVWDSLPALPWRVCSSGIAVIGSKIYVVGGADYNYEAFYTNTDRDSNVKRLGARLLAIDIKDLRAGWKELAECPGTPRWVAATAAVGGKLYLIGGATADDNAFKAYATVVDNWQYDPATNVWQRLRDLSVASGNFPSGPIVYSDHYILLVGGYQYEKVVNLDGSVSPTYGKASRSYPKDAYHSDVWVYDTRTNLFGTATGLPVNNNLPMTVVRGNQIHLVGGEMGGTPPDFETVEGEPFPKHPDLYLVGSIREIAD